MYSCISRYSNITATNVLVLLTPLLKQIEILELQYMIIPLELQLELELVELVYKSIRITVLVCLSWTLCFHLWKHLFSVLVNKPINDGLGDYDTRRDTI